MAVLKKVDKVLSKTDGHCVYCGILVYERENLNIDHIIPKSKGGKTKFDNLIPSCKSCNSFKGALTASEFATKAIRKIDELLTEIHKWHNIIKIMEANKDHLNG